MGRLDAYTGGSSEALAQLFPNVRGLNGVAALTSDNLETLAANIDEMTAAGRKFNQEKFLQATATDAEKVTAELNKLKNALTIDLGQAILSTVADLSELTGGADNAISVIKAAGPAIVGLGGSFLIFRGQIAAARHELTGLSRALGALSLVPVAAGLGSSLGKLIDDALTSRRGEALRALEESNKQELQEFKDTLAERRDAANAADEERVKNARRIIQELNRTYIQDTDNYKRQSDALVANTEAALNKILSARVSLVDELAKASAASQDIGRSSLDRVTGLQDRQSDRDFESRNRSLDEAQQVFALAKRASDLAASASADLTKSGLLGDVDGIATALQAFDRATGFGEQASDLAQRVGNRALEAKAVNDLRKLTEQQIVAEQKLTAAQKVRQAALDQERVKQQRIADAIREQTRIANANTGLFDANGQAFSEADQTKRIAAREKALREVANLALSQKDLSAQGALGIADFVSRFSGELARDPIHLAFDPQTDQLKAQLEAEFQGFRLKAPIDVPALEGVLGRSLTSPDQISAGIEEAITKTAELRAKIDQAVSAQPAAQNLREELDTIFQGIDDRAGRRGLFGGEGLDQLRSQFNPLLSQFRALRSDAQITSDELASLIDKRNEFGKAALEGENPLLGRLSFASDIVALDQAIPKLQALAGLQTQVDPGLQQQLDRFDAVLSTLQTTKQQFESAVTPARQIADEFERAANAAAQAAAAINLPAAAGGFANGGAVRFLAGGGFAPRGVDTIPIMAQAGESIINARSSRQFFSQIQAINAGQTPIFREDGGSVTSIGDINMTVNAGNQKISREMMKDIATDLRRQIRCGLRFGKQKSARGGIT